jgi:hypothetical protein
MKLKFAVLFLFLAGCAQKGCSGDKLTVILPPTYAVDETAEVQLAGEPFGYIETIETKQGLQQVSLRVQDITRVTDADRFVPWKDSRGNNGMRIVSRNGIPLRSDAVVDIVPGRFRRAAEQPHSGSGGRGQEQAASEGVARDGTSSQGRSKETVRAERLERMLDRVFQPEPGMKQVNTAGSRRFEELGVRLRNEPPEVIASILMREGEELERQLRDEALQTERSGDQEASKTLRRMVAQLSRLRRQAGRSGEKEPRESRGRRETRRIFQQGRQQ